MNLRIVDACGYRYLHAGSPPVVRRICHLTDADIPALLRSVADELCQPNAVPAAINLSSDAPRSPKKSSPSAGSAPDAARG